MYSLEEINLSPGAWDAAVRNYKTKFLFHESVWLAYLEQTQNGRRLLLSIRDGSNLIGYFCGVVVRKGPFRILGSPLRGWMTICMGPALDQFDQSAFLAALEDFCRSRGIDYVELCAPILEAAPMLTAGFASEDGVSLVVPILPQEKMWQRLTSECRNRIRRGQKNGLRVEVASDPEVMFDFYEQVQVVFAQKHLNFHHSREMIRALWDHLYPVGQLLAVRIFHDTNCVATGIFPFDERVIYFWGGASKSGANHLCPNELVHWTAMTFAAEHGIPLYDMCGGGGRFKAKFGAHAVPRIRYYKGLSASARIARELYKTFWFGRRQLFQRLRRWRSEERLATEPVGHEG